MLYTFSCTFHSFVFSLCFFQTSYHAVLLFFIAPPKFLIIIQIFWLFFFFILICSLSPHLYSTNHTIWHSYFSKMHPAFFLSIPLFKYHTKVTATFFFVFFSFQCVISCSFYFPFYISPSPRGILTTFYPYLPPPTLLFSSCVTSFPLVSVLFFCWPAFPYLSLSASLARPLTHSLTHSHFLSPSQWCGKHGSTLPVKQY